MAQANGTLPHSVLLDVLREGAEQSGGGKKLGTALDVAHTAYTGMFQPG